MLVVGGGSWMRKQGPWHWMTMARWILGYWTWPSDSTPGPASEPEISPTAAATATAAAKAMAICAKPGQGLGNMRPRELTLEVPWIDCRRGREPGVYQPGAQQLMRFDGARSRQATNPRYLGSQWRCRITASSTPVAGRRRRRQPARTQWRSGLEEGSGCSAGGTSCPVLRNQDA